LLSRIAFRQRQEGVGADYWMRCRSRASRAPLRRVRAAADHGFRLSARRALAPAGMTV